ncbi:hypothetical protein A3K34_02015 [candidate division WWE3 bacterium RIFOXYC1_FULL_40_10]|uniref:Lipid/polyisoprenoid-binding YceI-like domain-containing protein n=1 Tax=candidate division WWE3 bacterium RIFOXYA2_FULL_46_9 TaxID=1802636 RepID=A0A1F4VZS1_UNCKA|nr:MAG: hypothetical protein A3K58_02015 [candidate division WWE3 bacterium RIFOXYB1_FULL_40_22]OGC61631.1 MAG: hypothetical protein A3K37_02015 [candidate division WWE3 bacterium RIFOXYA1_FULL_40_11]OGC62664.1 MAG: hypothetical protein A2264_02200 [candidate division WWE3 bacterium RIFOXYA2_FULL_46_9]OGC64692.1 MAG: hypothetical protein A2326_01430 [candidate division WWE3 bacterium RIFOXYB2_FULL_41_6]OGC66014.1 MAG: hypothetical protein A3K34_02015 [candidate division WWE3 bacterium RIFOXYC1_
MDKKTILIPIALLVISSAFVYFSVLKPKDTPCTPDTCPVVQQTAVVPSETLGATTGLMEYQISKESTVSYTVQKVFVNQPLLMVTGQTDQITGSGWYNPETKEYELIANISLDTLKSDNSTRDSDVIKLFNPSIGTVKVASSDNQIKPEYAIEYKEKVNIEVSINGIAKTIPFDVTALFDENTVSAKGNATIDMKDFGITPPSLLGIYTVDPVTTISFDVKGFRAN